MKKEVKNQELVTIVEAAQLEPTKVEAVINGFSSLFQEAREWEAKAKAINVTDESQVAEMKQAREIRLGLKKVRTTAESKRKELKEQIVREGKAIDGVANVIKALIEPLEEHLEKQEKFIETREAEKKEALRNERLVKLAQYAPDMNIYTVDDTYINLREVNEDFFNKHLEGIRRDWQDAKDATAKIEADRIDKEKKDKEEKERLEKENAKLRADAEAKAKEDAEKRAIEEKERSKERDVINAALEAERIAREKIAAELQAKKDLEAKIEQERRDKETAALKAKQEAESAPDKEKLLELATHIENIELPKVTSEGALKLLLSIKQNLAAISKSIKADVKNL